MRDGRRRSEQRLDCEDREAGDDGRDADRRRRPVGEERRAYGCTQSTSGSARAVSAAMTRSWGSAAVPSSTSPSAESAASATTGTATTSA